MKKLFSLIIALLVIMNIYGLSVVYAHEHNFEEVETLIESKIPCDQLTEDQLEGIGDYYMEQMHPGEAHEVMDEMMGGEGSESLRDMHIRMARSFYCGEKDAMSSGMMNMMMGGVNNMGGNGMMANNFGYGMMGNFSPFGWNWGFGFIFMIIFWGLIIWLIAWIVMKLIKSQERSESALEILKKRFAKGEITKKEFEDMKKRL